MDRLQFPEERIVHLGIRPQSQVAVPGCSAQSESRTSRRARRTCHAPASGLEDPTDTLDLPSTSTAQARPGIAPLHRWSIAQLLNRS